MSSMSKLRQDDRILAVFDKPGHFAGGIVLARASEGYVTWGFNKDGDTYHGHYFADKPDDASYDLQLAKADFVKRVKSEMGVYDEPQSGITKSASLMDRLPPQVAINIDGEVVLIKRGEEGYYPTTGEGHDKDAINRAITAQCGIKIDEYVEQAMINGSMFGWSALGADPEYLRERNR